ncbi:lysine 2,3-aminomutase, partial [Agrobacterium vitis]|nr:lysine 2,3-aminomutase [Agrobacterium vitis]MVA43333.1 lysine 2,3-aminomutase [Agrobacterium vitis]
MTASVKTVKTVRELVETGLVAAETGPELDAVAARYAIAITPAMLALIDPNDPTDPIAAQFVPQAGELVHQPVERADPIGDHA